jgi:multimeric flavodoxin WrbA
MRISVLVGSARKNGLSSQVCDLLRQQFNSRNSSGHFIYLAEKNIEFCDADNLCEQSPCRITDDMPIIIRDLQASDGIIYMPVMHAYGTNSKFQAFLERAGYGYLRPMDRPLKDKIASIIVVGRRYGHTAAYGQIVLNIMLNKMIMAGSGFPTLFMGMLGDALNDSEALDSLEQTIDRMHAIYHRLNRSSMISSNSYNATWPSNFDCQ